MSHFNPRDIDPAIVKAQPTRGGHDRGGYHGGRGGGGGGGFNVANIGKEQQPEKKAPPPAPKAPPVFIVSAVKLSEKTAPKEKKEEGEEKEEEGEGEGEEKEEEKTEEVVKKPIVAGEAVTFTTDVDYNKNCVIACEDAFVLLSQKNAEALPQIAEAVKAATPETPAGPIKFKAAAVIAANHWVEHCEGATKSATSKFPEKVAHTDFASLLQTDWEKDFFNKHLCKSGQTEVLFQTTKLAEALGMDGLLEFCIVAIGCVIRGKSNHAMALALGREVEALEPEDLAAGREEYPWGAEIASIE